MKNLVISNHPTTGQIAGIASCMEKITMYQFHSDRWCLPKKVLVQGKARGGSGSTINRNKLVSQTEIECDRVEQRNMAD
jgi:hypothetical protein